MAIPTVTSISPAAGTPTGGQLVQIIGTGFQLPAPPPADLIPVPESPPTVRVLFGGTEAPLVAVISDTRLLVRTPKRSMPLDASGKTLGEETVAIDIANIDAAGIVIPGEEINIPDAYLYLRPQIEVNVQGKWGVTRVTEQLIDLLRSECLANTVPDTSVDFDPDTSTFFIEPQNTPQLVLTGPTLTFNAFFTYRGDYVVPGINPGEGFLKRRHRVVDLSYEIMGVTNNSVELNNLIELLGEVIDRNVTLPIETFPGSGEFYPMELRWLTDPAYIRPGPEVGYLADVRVFNGTIQVRGYAITDFQGVPWDNIENVGYEVDTPTLEPALQIGENLPTVQGGPTRSPPDEGIPGPPPFPIPGAPRRSPPDNPGDH